jgi:hypothetical protein
MKYFSSFFNILAYELRSEVYLAWKFATEWNGIMLKISIALFNYNIEKINCKTMSYNQVESPCWHTQ